MVQLLILADDFTGACDAAGACAAASWTTVVLLAPQADAPSDAHVLAVDLDLRERSDREALAETEAIAHQFSTAHPEARMFLKIDSTLRGPIAGLVAGALHGSARALAVIAPAFPEQGRLLHEGKVVLAGKEGASLPHVLGLDGTALLSATFARSAEEVERAVDHARARGARRVVVDTDGSDCLRSVARAWDSHPEWLLVGSAGLARQLAPTPPPATPDILTTSEPLLIVAGSPATATQAQVEKLTALDGVFRLDLPISSAVHGEVMLLRSPPTSERDEGEAARALADATAAWAAERRPRAAILTGGATARLVCERLGARAVRLHGELRPGIPVGQLVGGAWDGLTVVTKAGGFGTPDTLVDLARALGA